MRDDENLILTGFMGAGKTCVGEELARRLGREFVDMDRVIEARQGMAVADIFAGRGEVHFRRLEADLCRELAARTGIVVATGGGTLLPAANREILSASGPAVCLSASPDEILSRLEAATDRPLLDAGDRQGRIAALLAERTPGYGRIPLQVDTTGLTVSQVADRVLALVSRQAEAAPVSPIPVRYPGGEYPVHLGRGLLAQAGTLFRWQGLDGRVVLVTNPTVGSLYADPVVTSLETAGFQVAVCTVPEGEAHKTLGTLRGLYDGLIEAGLDRHGAVLALGGGVVGDLAGLAAATYLRGVAFVQLPTTLLAMVDASVGGKVAVDHPRGKNLIGAFKQPRLVVADPDALSTLPAAEFRNGLAETVKAGLIADPALFEQIEEHGPAPLPWIVERAVRVKVAVVEEDPHETGRRAVLNLGHTFGHALELASGYGLSHGQGVSVGLVAAARLSARLGFCDAALVARVEDVLRRLGLPTAYRGHTPARLWQAMAADKKRRGARLRFVLLHAVGDPFVTEQVAEAEVLAVLETLREA
jgi:shikimate kinase/3-dehydroquinate synthase